MLGSKDSNYKLGPEQSGTKNIRFIDSHIAVLSDALCKSFLQVEEVLLNQLDLTTINSNAFVGCENIKILNLNQNQLTHLDDDLFTKQKSLEQVDLSGNRLQWISTNMFINAREHLKHLDLSSNQLQVFTVDNTVKMPALEVISFAGNRLIDIDAEEMKSNFPKLREVSLVGNLIMCGRSQEIVEVLKRIDLGSYKANQCLNPIRQPTKNSTHMVPVSVFQTTKNLLITILIFVICILLLNGYLAFVALKAR